MHTYVVSFDNVYGFFPILIVAIINRVQEMLFKVQH
jgi:hypothetical protein